MNLLKKLFRRDRGYRGDGFTVRIISGQREIVSITHERAGVQLKLGGERIGKKWDAVDVRIPQDIDAERARQVARDLETAFRVKGLRYLIARSLGEETVPQAEREAAEAELREMGLEAKAGPDSKSVSIQKGAAFVPRGRDDWRKLGPRMMALVSAIRGKRARFEILAQSKDAIDSADSGSE